MPADPLPLLHRDPHLVAWLKPSGLLVHNSAWSGPREESLARHARAVLGVPVFGVHRLDRGASGVVLLALDADTARALQDAWHGPPTRKHYLALVRGNLEGAQVVDHPVTGEDGVRRDARSTVRALCPGVTERVTLVAVEIHTGRHHQVRRHLKHLRHPVVGDASHGDNRFNRALVGQGGPTRLALHAHRLTLTHPVTGEALALHAPVPADLATPLDTLLGPGWRARVAAEVDGLDATVERRN
ncbi:MAG: pseudouridylate synthase [Deltaproteobacteria bacterium]|nr:pseudouridylate synthase [Deltaproteobacteria bacterium]